MFPDKSSGQTHCLETAWAALRRTEKLTILKPGLEIAAQNESNKVKKNLQLSPNPGPTLYRGASAMSYWSQPQNLRLTLP